VKTRSPRRRNPAGGVSVGPEIGDELDAPFWQIHTRVAPSNLLPMAPRRWLVRGHSHSKLTAYLGSRRCEVP
jgi:hypothetical protein